MNRRLFVSLLGLAPVGGFAFIAPVEATYEIRGAVMTYSDGRIFDWVNLAWRERCPTCKGANWVCEAHPDQPFNKQGCECGAGMPCRTCGV